MQGISFYRTFDDFFYETWKNYDLHINGRREEDASFLKSFPEAGGKGSGFWITRPRSGKGFELCFFNLRPCPQLHSGGWEDETVDIKVSGTTKQVWLLDSRWFHSWNWIFWPLDLPVGPGNSKARAGLSSRAFGLGSGPKSRAFCFWGPGALGFF